MNNYFNCHVLNWRNIHLNHKKILSHVGPNIPIMLDTIERMLSTTPLPKTHSILSYDFLLLILFSFKLKLIILET